MRKLLVIGVLALFVAVPGLASASKVVPIVMRDPGCHWFKVGAKYSVTYVSHGPIAVQNLDMAALMGEGGGVIGSAGVAMKRALGIATTLKAVLGLSEFEKGVGKALDASLSYDPKSAGAAVNSGQPLPVASPRSPIVRDLRQLTALFAGPAQAAPKRRVFALPSLW